MLSHLRVSSLAYSRLQSENKGTPFYAVKIDAEIWVLHAFQKKSKTGIKTPQIEVDLLRDRLKRLKEALK